MDSNQINYGIKIWSSFMVLIMEHGRILVFHWDGFQIVPVWRNDINCCYLFILPMQILPRKGSAMLSKLAEWRSGSVSALPCERPGFASRTRLRETSTVYWCIASKLKAARNLYWMSNMFLGAEIFLFFVCYHVFPKRHSQLDYELNDL